jgi:hypothetical protein
MITGIRTTPLGNEVLKDFVDGRDNRIKVSQRDITLMATCTRSHFTEWGQINAQLPNSQPRQLLNCILKLEKLKLVELERPVPTEQPGHRTRFGFDKEGKHHWV